MNHSKNESQKLGMASIVDKYSILQFPPNSPRGIFSIVCFNCFVTLILVFGLNSTPLYGQQPMVEFEGHTGILIPRMSTEEIASITDPVDGMLLYDSTLDHFFYFSNLSGTWRQISVVGKSEPTLPSNLSDPNNGTIPHQPSGQVDWNVQGNEGANSYSSDPPLLGTVDRVPVVFITDDSLRMQIMADGDITIAKSLDINTESGETTNHGPFTVADQSPSLLTGTLTVDRRTQLNSDLEVFGPTVLNSTLLVDNGSSSEFTGQVLISDVTQSDSAQFSNGALVVAGGTGIGKNLNVGGNLAIKGSAAFGGPVDFASQVKFNAIDQSTDLTTGSIVVAGGAAIGRRLNVGGMTSILDATTSTSPTTGALKVTGGVGIGENLNVMGNSLLTGTLGVTNSTTSTTPSTGALKVTGGAGIGENLNVGGDLKVNTDVLIVNSTKGQVTIKTSTLSAKDIMPVIPNLHIAGVDTELGAGPPSVYDMSYDNYPLRIEGGNLGIAIKIKGARSNKNNFVSFWDDTQMWGRIEGEIPAEYNNNTDYTFDQRSLAYDVADGILDLVFATTALVMTATNTVAAATSATACLGLGACVTSPIPSLIAASVADVIVAVAQEVTAIAAAVISVTNLTTYNTNKTKFQGVTYASGAGDYAEYLLRADINEKLSFGDIVGVKGGRISKNTIDAEKFMVVSHKPIVLGNMPQPNKENEYEKIAFMGQVPVKVFGKVNIGDYIVSMGINNGIGMAVSPANIKSTDIKQIVGIAWSSIEDTHNINMINVAVGININDNTLLVENLEKQVSFQTQEISGLKQQIAEITKIITGLVSGSSSPSASQSLIDIERHKSIALTDYEIVQPHANDIIYYKITRQNLEKGLKMAEYQMRQHGVDIEKNEFWKLIKTDSNYKNDLFTRIEKTFENAIHYHEGINEGDETRN